MSGAHTAVGKPGVPNHSVCAGCKSVISGGTAWKEKKYGKYMPMCARCVRGISVTTSTVTIQSPVPIGVAATVEAPRATLPSANEEKQQWVLLHRKKGKMKGTCDERIAFAARCMECKSGSELFMVEIIPAMYSIMCLPCMSQSHLSINVDLL